MKLAEVNEAYRLLDNLLSDLAADPNMDDVDPDQFWIALWEIHQVLGRTLGKEHAEDPRLSAGYL